MEMSYIKITELFSHSKIDNKVYFKHPLGVDIYKINNDDDIKTLWFRVKNHNNFNVYNYININGEYISDEWFDEGLKFDKDSESVFVIKENKLYVLYRNGKLSNTNIDLSKFYKHYLKSDDITDFIKIKVFDRENEPYYNYIDKNLQMLYPKWLSKKEVIINNPKDYSKFNFIVTSNLNNEINILKEGKFLFKENYFRISVTEDCKYFKLTKRFIKGDKFYYHDTITDINGNFLLKNFFGKIKWYYNLFYAGFDVICISKRNAPGLYQMLYIGNENKKYNKIKFNRFNFIGDEFIVIKNKANYEKDLYHLNNKGEKFLLKNKFNKINLTPEYLLEKKIIFVETLYGYNLYNLSNNTFLLEKDCFEISFDGEYIIIKNNDLIEKRYILCKNYLDEYILIEKYIMRNVRE